MRNPKDYLNPEKKFTAAQTILSEKEIVFEFMLNALRLTHGVPAQLFIEHTGLPLSALEPMLTEAKNKKLLLHNAHTTLCATELGQRFLNDLTELFLPKTT